MSDFDLGDPGGSGEGFFVVLIVAMILIGLIYGFSKSHVMQEYSKGAPRCFEQQSGTIFQISSPEKC